MLRNYVYLHAIENELALPIGTQDAELLDPGVSDEDENALLPDAADENGDGGETTLMTGMIVSPLHSEEEYRR